MDKDIFIGKVIIKPEPIAKVKRQSRTKQTYPETADIIRYRAKDDFFYISRTVKGIETLYEIVWIIDAIHAGKLYSHPRNTHWPEWTEIKWPELTTSPVRLEMIFKQWSPFKPGSIVDVVIENDVAKVVKVHE